MDINYKVNRSRKRRKTISLHVHNEGNVVVSVPYFTSTDEINSFVQEKQNWINKTIKRQKEDAAKNRAKEYETGEYFLYLGEYYPLEVFFEPFENAGVFLYNDRFYLNARKEIHLKKHYFVSWYKKKAYDFIRQRVDCFSRRLKYKSGNIKITSAQSRWGSCSGYNNLAFSFRLIMAPPHIIDYVIVHELTHIKEKNHSPKFWQKVEEVVPEYKKYRRWLKDNRHNFVL